MISWAGHGEDQIILRILGGRKPGTFIDIGAAHPKFGSVTFTSYKLGWRGIAVEPRVEVSKYWKKLRPDDFLMSVAVTTQGNNGYLSAQGFRSQFFDETVTGLNARYTPVEAISTAELAKLTREKLFEAPTFVKIDIEGSELEIVCGLLENGVIPEFWIIEVVDQFGSEHIRRPASKKIKKIMESYNYRLTLFDGVNEWYALRSSISLNANIWAPAYPGVEKFIPFHLTISYRMRNYVHMQRTGVTRSVSQFLRIGSRR